jgi:hypothetical protein
MVTKLLELAHWILDPLKKSNPGAARDLAGAVGFQKLDLSLKVRELILSYYWGIQNILVKKSPWLVIFARAYQSSC